jgi:type I restriction enzyme, S subunit
MKKKFADFVTLQRGFDLPKANMHEGPFPVVGSTSIIGYHDKYKVEPPGVVTGRSGSLGSVQFINERFWPHNTSLWVKDFKGNDPRFVYYCLKGLDFARFNAGAGVPTLNRNHLDTLEVNAPSLAVQRRIAGILSPYDDLIENNTRRIAALEEMARRIYDEWFVRFRFLGHESTRMVESELGPVPQGWEVTSLGQLAEINARSVKRGSEPTDIRYVDIASVSTGRIDNKEPMRFTDAPGRARRIVRDGDVIWSCVRPNRKSYALVLDPEPDLLASTGFAVLSHVAVPWSFLYQCVTTNDFVSYLVNHAKGAAYPAVGADEFVNARVLKPADGILTEFDHIVEPMMRLVSVFQRENVNLGSTRDLLLPKLISGELDVSSCPSRRRSPHDPAAGVREISAGYGELALVEMPAIDLLTSLGWSFKNLYAETFGDGQRRAHERVPGHPDPPPARGAGSAEPRPARRRLRAGRRAARARPLQADRRQRQPRLLRLLKDGVKVKVPERTRRAQHRDPARDRLGHAGQQRVLPGLADVGGGRHVPPRCDLLASSTACRWCSSS